jgi:hypothetical protein
MQCYYSTYSKHLKRSALGDTRLHTGEASNVLLALLHNDARDDAHVGIDDATTGAFLLALTGAAGAVARGT